MLMNDIYIASFIFLAQELVVEPSFLPRRNPRYLSTKIVSSCTPLRFLWVGSPLVHKAEACDDGEDILTVFSKGFASFQTPFS